MNPIPAQDPFGYQSGVPLPTTPGHAASLSGGRFGFLPDPSTGSRSGGQTMYAVSDAPVDDSYQGIWRNWAQDSMGHAPRIPTMPDFNSGNPGNG